MKKFKHAILFTPSVFFALTCLAQGPVKVPGSEVSISSPDKNTRLDFYQELDEAGNRTMYYNVSYKNKPVVLKSSLNIQLHNLMSEKAMNLKVDGHLHWCENMGIKNIRSTSKDTTWIPPYGENSTVRDHYNETDITLVKDDNPIYVMEVQIRAYNEGMALRYHFPRKPQRHLLRCYIRNRRIYHATRYAGVVCQLGAGCIQQITLNQLARRKRAPTYTGAAKRPLCHTCRSPDG